MRPNIQQMKAMITKKALESANETIKITNRVLVVLNIEKMAEALPITSNPLNMISIYKKELLCIFERVDFIASYLVIDDSSPSWSFMRILTLLMTIICQTNPER
jgi:hypothetical protein